LRPRLAARGHASSREAIWLLALAGFNTGISLRCVEPMLPKLAEEFDTSVSRAATVITTFAFAYAASLLVQGPLGDRFGKLRVVTAGMGLAGLASIACAFAWSIESLAGFRLATGMFASAAVALGMAYIGDVVPLGERQMTIAHFIGGSLLGQTLGPLVGGVFTDWVGWRASFAALGAVFLLVSAVLFVRTAPGWPAAVWQKLELVALYRRLLSRPAMRWLLLIGVGETFFYFGAYAFLGAFLKLRFDLSFTTIGLVLAGYGVGGLLYTASARMLIRTLGERGMVLVGGVLGAVLFLAVVVVPHWAYTIPCTIGLGVAFYLIHNTVQTKATEVAPDARGSAVALYASGWALGQAAGVAAIGLAVAALGYEPAIMASGLAFGAVGLWLRYNLHRLRP
jgi:MFS transporter, YNFM family, putative membrane transport protein